MNSTKAGVLRYLGHRGQTVPPELDTMLDECVAAVRKGARARRVWKAFDLTEQAGRLSLAGGVLTLQGADIRRHLQGCARVALMAVTLGVAADSRIRSWQPADLTRALVLDACATQLVEEACDELEDEIHHSAAAGGLSATGRFSPGYGDLSLEAQAGILTLLDAGRRIGLTCSADHLLLPRKSVTAIVGLGAGMAGGGAGCAACVLRGRCCYSTEDGGYSNDCIKVD